MPFGHILVLYVPFDLFQVPDWKTNYISLIYYYGYSFHPNTTAFEASVHSHIQSLEGAQGRKSLIESH